MMNIYEGMKRFLQPHNYNVIIQQNQSFDQSGYTPGFYRPFDDTSHQYQSPFQSTSCLFAYQPSTDHQFRSIQPPQNYQQFDHLFDENYKPSGQQFDNPPTTDQLRSIQPPQNYQQFDHLFDENYKPSGQQFDNPPTTDQFRSIQPPQNYQQFDHLFDENYKPSGHKRAREYYDDDDFSCGPNFAKKHRLAQPCVKYAFKTSSQYPQSMKTILDKLFESEIDAEGWEKGNGQFRYHIKIRGINYQRVSSSIDNAREEVSVLALKELCNYEFENISWPRNLIPYRLEQSFADAIEIMVKNKFDDLMIEKRYKAHKVRSGIVMTTEMSIEDAKVVAVGTGSKCFSDIKNDESGTILHDMHAEVLARRSFVRFLYNQLLAMVDGKSSIFYLDGDEIQLKPYLKFHLYINTIPCGDARVFSLKGCAELKRTAKQGSLRTKKIGGTAIITETTDGNRDKSMSCSDKIARWNMLGLQGAKLAKFIKPIYLESIVLGSYYVPYHLHRAIFGRLDSASDHSLPEGYRLNKPMFESTFVMEVTNFAASEMYGVCWSEGHRREVLNLNTGLSISYKQSSVSKASFKNSFEAISQKMPNGSDEGIRKYNQAKELFYTTLKMKNFGVWKN